MATPRRTRLVLVPGGGLGEPFRRYRLARLDEVALASPASDGSGAPQRPEPAGDGVEGTGAVRDRRVPR